MKNTSTVNLIANKENARAELFKKLLGTKAKIVKHTNYEKECNIFFNFDTFETDKNRMIATFVDMEEKNALSILDISQEISLNDDFLFGSYLIVAVVCAGFVTCSNDRIQEELYNQTGRLAYLIEESVAFKFKKPSSPTQVIDNLKILWYGKTKDIMSVRPYLTKSKYNINVACPYFISNTQDRANIFITKTKEQEKVAIYLNDIVFLPKTYTFESEIDRYKKVEEVVAAGKFVIAPELELDETYRFAYNGDLEDGLTYIQNTPKEVMLKELQHLQKLLKQKENKKQTKKHLEKALLLAQTDDYAKNLDELLDSGAFPI